MTVDIIQPWQLAQRQALPLDMKVELSLRRIRAWHDHWRGQICVAFSGGFCSTVLLDLVRRAYPACPAVHVNTGLEFPENEKLVKETENVVVLRPDKNFKRVIEEYGWPVTTKRTAQYIHEVRVNRERHPGEYTPTQRLRLTGYRSSGEHSKLSVIPKKWQFLLEAPFKVSDRCCHWMKKRPSRKIEKERGWRPFLGTRCDEAKGREKAYLMVGCNAFHLKSPRSTPLAFWTTRDTRDYAEQRRLRISEAYAMGYERTGCVFCAFGAHLEKPPNRFQRLQRTHPGLWRYCMHKLGLREVLEHCGIAWRDGEDGAK